MTDGTTVSARIPKETAIDFEKALETVGVTKSDFITKCIEKLTQGSASDKEMFLAFLGFQKKAMWTK